VSIGGFDQSVHHARLVERTSGVVDELQLGFWPGAVEVQAVMSPTRCQVVFVCSVTINPLRYGSMGG
jgi:hypothetical protein